MITSTVTNDPLRGVQAPFGYRLLPAVLGALAIVLLTAPLALAAPTWLLRPDLSLAGESASRPQVAINSAGEAVAVWERSNGTNSIIQSAIAPPGGSFSAPVDLSLAGKSAFAPQVAINAAGEAVAVWGRSNGTNTIIQSATRPAGGAFPTPSTAVDLSLAGGNAADPQVAINAAGEAVAVWRRTIGTDTIIQSAIAPPGGSFSAPVDLSPAAGSALEPQIAIDAAGEAVAVWKASIGTDTIVQSAIRPAGGAFPAPPAPVDLSRAGESASEPQIAIDAAGEAVAVWRRSNGTNTIIQSAIRPADGVFPPPSAAVDLSLAGKSASRPQVAINATGEAVAVWERFNGTDTIIQSAIAPPGGSFSAPVDLSPAGGSAFAPQVAIDAAGEAVAVWERLDGTNFIIQAASTTNTETKVLCSPSTVILATASTCVATVTDRDTANNPSGDIAFTSNKEPAGAFSPAASCHLVPEGTDKATCQLTYTPATILGDHQITATYNPEDNRFAASSGEDTVTVSPVPPNNDATTTALDCTPGSLILATASTCVATVTDNDTANNPSGDIAFTSNKEPAGTFSPAPSCHLVPEGTNKATCQRTYTPATIVGDHQITATYNPEDNRFAASSGEDTVTVSPLSPSKGATTTTLDCAPGSLVLGGSSTCVATVGDTAAVGKAPSGQIKFASDGPGAFSGGGSCTLANAGAHRSSCQLTYKPSALGPGPGTHHLSAIYSGDASHLQSEGASQLTVSQLTAGAAPETKILKKPRKKTASRKALFTFSADQPGSSFQCRLDKRPFKSCRSRFKIRKLKKGRHVFRVKAINPQGIADPTPALFRWRVSG